MQKRGGYRSPYEEGAPFVEVAPGVRIPYAEFALDGIEVFNFSVREVPAAVRDLLAFAETSPEDVDAFVFHQANAMINNMIRKLLALPEARVPTTLRDFGNTSSASIPLTIVEGLRERLREEPLKLLMCGFGVGLSWGTVLMDAGPIVCPELVEV
jgi:3-oxoacyl-[acyl-carrier-protein] synthase-3